MPRGLSGAGEAARGAYRAHHGACAVSGYMSSADEHAITHQMAGLVATELDGWTVDTSEDFREHRGAYLDGPNGARLFLSLDWRNSDRVEVSGIFPRHSCYEVKRTEIGVSRDRGPAVIAREITRRLLPTYLTELARVQASNDERVVMRARRQEMAKTFAAIVGGTVDEEKDDDTRTRVRWYSDFKGYGHVDISYRADSISELEVRSTSPERIEAALRALFAQS